MKLIEALLQIFVTNALSCILKISQDSLDVIYTSLWVNFSRFHSVLFLLKLLHDSSFNCSTKLSRWRLFLKPPGGRSPPWRTSKVSRRAVPRSANRETREPPPISCIWRTDRRTSERSWIEVLFINTQWTKTNLYDNKFHYCYDIKLSS